MGNGDPRTAPSFHHDFEFVIRLDSGECLTIYRHSFDMTELLRYLTRDIFENF